MKLEPALRRASRAKPSVWRRHRRLGSRCRGGAAALAGANRYRFSSKEWEPNAGLYYYGYRFYDPNLQRWVNRDPLGEDGGINLFAILMNCLINNFDPMGLCDQFSDYTQPEDNNLHLWPPQTTPLFPSPPVEGWPKAPEIFAKDAGKEIGKDVLDHNKRGLDNLESNAMDKLGINPSQMGTGEQLGLGAAAGAGKYGAGQGISLSHNFTKNISVGFSISPSGPGFTKPSSCMGTVSIKF